MTRGFGAGVAAKERQRIQFCLRLIGDRLSRFSTGGTSVVGVTSAKYCRDQMGVIGKQVVRRHRRALKQRFTISEHRQRIFRITFSRLGSAKDSAHYRPAALPGCWRCCRQSRIPASGYPRFLTAAVGAASATVALRMALVSMFRSDRRLTARRHSAYRLAILRQILTSMR